MMKNIYSNIYSFNKVLNKTVQYLEEGNIAGLPLTVYLAGNAYSKALNIQIKKKA